LARNAVPLGVSWLTRVPQTIKEAKQLLAEVAEEDFEASTLAGYRIAVRESNYGNVAQRWLIIKSEAAQEAAGKALKKRLSKLEKELQQELKGLGPFNYQADAQQAVQTFAGKLKYHRLLVNITAVKHYLKPGRPS
jgi:transposase